MAKRLYVGGLPFRSTEDSIRDEFSKAGTVESVTIITDRFSGRSRGFGFVEMSTEDEAKKAIEMFDGQDFDGRKLTVNEAKEPQGQRNMAA